MVEKHKVSVFLDTNIMVSGFYSPMGPPGKILEHFLNGRITIIVSRSVLHETIRFFREKSEVGLLSFNKLLINSPPIIIKDPAETEIVKWARVINYDDAKILACAVIAQPDYFITGDKHFFANKLITKKSGLKIVTPAQFLEEFEAES